MNILVIVVTYNAMQWIDRCLGGVRSSNLPADIFVVDNGSTDGTRAYIKDHFPEAHLIESSENLMFGRANNLGLRYALDNNYDYVYLLNQDAWIFPDTLEKLIEVHKQHPEYGILSPMHLQGNGNYFDEHFGSYTLSYESCPEVISDLFFKRTKEIYEVDFVCAAHWLITRKCLETVGGFSPTFPHYGEDDNYLHRVKYFSLSIGVVMSANAVHDREFRKKWDVKQQRYYWYIKHLIEYSNLNETIDYYLIRVILNTVRMIKNLGLQLIPYFFRLLRERRRILENRERSKESCAFL